MTIRFAVLSLLALTVVRASNALPVQAGEQLTYRVSWAILGGAGEIKIGAQVDPVQPHRLSVVATTATRRLVRMLMAYDARSESIYDLKTGLLTSVHETQKTKDREKDYTVTFDHADRRASFVTRTSTEPTLITMPAEDPADIIMALLRTRSWDLKPGQSRDALVIVEGQEFYELTIHALRYEDVETPLGTFNSLLLEPRMEKTPPKGMFRRGSSAKVWIAQGENHLPVRFSVEFKVGTGIATLESYTPPPKVAPASGNAKNPAP